jgi:hypothetical protein
LLDNYRQRPDIGESPDAHRWRRHRPGLPMPLFFYHLVNKEVWVDYNNCAKTFAS